MLLKENFVESKKKPKRVETRNYSLMLWLERRLLKKLKKPRDYKEERRLLNFKSTTNNLLVTKKPMRNSLMNLSNKRLKDNIRCVRLNGIEKSKLE